MNVHKMFLWRPGRYMNVVFTLSLGRVSAEQMLKPIKR